MWTPSLSPGKWFQILKSEKLFVNGRIKPRSWIYKLLLWLKEGLNDYPCFHQANACQPSISDPRATFWPPALLAFSFSTWFPGTIQDSTQTAQNQSTDQSFKLWFLRLRPARPEPTSPLHVGPELASPPPNKEVRWFLFSGNLPGALKLSSIVQWSPALWPSSWVVPLSILVYCEAPPSS